MPHPLKPSLSLHRPKPLGARFHPPRLGSVDPHRCGALGAHSHPTSTVGGSPPVKEAPPIGWGAGRGRLGLRGSGEAQGIGGGAV